MPTCITIFSLNTPNRSGRSTILMQQHRRRAWTTKSSKWSTASSTPFSKRSTRTRTGRSTSTSSSEDSPQIPKSARSLCNSKPCRVLHLLTSIRFIELNYSFKESRKGERCKYPVKCSSGMFNSTRVSRGTIPPCKWQYCPINKSGLPLSHETRVRVYSIYKKCLERRKGRPI